MPETFEIDLDGEQILFDGAWFSKEELARKIKTMVESDDYRVSRPSAALEALENALSGLRTLSIRLPNALAEQLAAEAARAGQPVGAYVRDILVRSLQPGQSFAATQPPRKTMLQRAEARAEPIQLSSVHVAVTEPASADEAAGAIPLRLKRPNSFPGAVPPSAPREPAPLADSDIEKGWFNRR